MRNWANRPCLVLIVSGFDGREMYASYLEYEGMLVSEATGPLDALRALDLFHPDVLVTDFVFPGTAIDAPTFIERIRSHRERAQPAIVVVSGYTRPEDECRARAAGADDFVLKPCLPADLLAHVLRTVATRNTADAFGTNDESCS